MDRQAETSRDDATEARQDREACSFYEIPATMPFPEYGEPVPVSFVQLVD